MALIVAIANQKGGVGKTTTAVSLASYLASDGKFVLLVDFDPQANATSSLGINRNEIKYDVYQAIGGIVSFREVIKKSSIPGLSIAPATPDLSGANIELVNIENREFQLSNALLEIRNNYDLIIIDCPPSLGLLTVNALTAADKVLIPVQAEYLALEGLGQLLETINLIKENLNPKLEILGALITMYDGRVRLSQSIFEEIYHYFPEKIFRSVIPRSVKLAEAPSYGMPISKYDSLSRGASAYERLSREILEMIENSFNIKH